MEKDSARLSIDKVQRIIIEAHKELPKTLPPSDKETELKQRPKPTIQKRQSSK